MERDAIERLAIDSAAGELNEDTGALFKEYLAEHPDANKWVEDMLGIYEKTEAAVDIKTKRAAGTDTITANVGTKHRSTIQWLPIARWAAVVIFAAFIGVAAGRWSKSVPLERNPQRTTLSQDSTVERPSLDLESIGESFWQKKAMAMLTSPSSKIHGDYVTGPKLWDRYRQFIKEKNYE